MSKETRAGRRGGRSSRRETAAWAALGLAWLLVYCVRFFRFAMSFIPDQASTGMLASGLVDGLAVSPWHYQFMTGHGGLVMGLLLAPFYYIWGSQFLWIKIVGAWFVVGAVVVWTSLLRRAWGFAPAAIFLLLLVAPAPFLEWHSHNFFGNHIESLFFVGLVILLFLRLNEREPQFGGLVALGAVAGFGSFFCSQILPVAAAVFVAMAWRWDRRGVRRILWPTAPAFLVMYGVNWLDPRRTAFFEKDTLLHPHLVERWRQMLGDYLPNLPGYDGPWHVLSYLLMALAAVGVALAAARAAAGRRQKGPAPKDWLGRVLLLYLGFYFAAASLTTHVLDPSYSIVSARYFLPVFAAFLAFAADALRRAPGILKYVLVAPFVAAGLVHAATYVPFAHADFYPNSWRLMTKMRGDDYEYLIRVNFASTVVWDDNLNLALNSIAALPGRWRESACRSLGEWLPPDKTAALVLDDPAALRFCRQPAVAGAGARISRMAVRHDVDPLDQFLAVKANYLDQIQKLSKDDAVEFAEGLGYGLMRYNQDDRRNFHSDEFFALLREGGDWRRAPVDLERQRRELTPILGALSGLSPAELATAFLQGAGRHLGFMGLNPLVSLENYRQFWLGFLDLPPPPDGTAAIEAGFFEGQAQVLIAYYNRLTVEPPFVDVPRIREALARRGVTLRQARTNPEEFVLIEENKRAVGLSN